MVNILHQNPQKTVSEILGDNSFEMAKGGIPDDDLDSEFQEFEV